MCFLNIFENCSESSYPTDAAVSATVNFPEPSNSHARRIRSCIMYAFGDIPSESKNMFRR